MMRYTLGKEDKLKSAKLIEQLFAEGSRVKSFPLQLIYLQKKHTSALPIQVGFSVPKRNIKLAVHRNRIKRMMREVYRLNKQLFFENMHNSFIFMFIYMANEEIKYAELEESLKNICSKFLTKINEDEQN